MPKLKKTKNHILRAIRLTVSSASHTSHDGGESYNREALVADVRGLLTVGYLVTSNKSIKIIGIVGIYNLTRYIWFIID